jgi:hypothetical protein
VWRSRSSRVESSRVVGSWSVLEFECWRSQQMQNGLESSFAHFTVHLWGVLTSATSKGSFVFRHLTVEGRVDPRQPISRALDVGRHHFRGICALHRSQSRDRYANSSSGPPVRMTRKECWIWKQLDVSKAEPLQGFMEATQAAQDQPWTSLISRIGGTISSALLDRGRGLRFRIGTDARPMDRAA